MFRRIFSILTIASVIGSINCAPLYGEVSVIESYSKQEKELSKKRFQAKGLVRRPAIQTDATVVFPSKTGKCTIHRLVRKSGMHQCKKPERKNDSIRGK